MTITCQKCASQNRDGANFCNECGASLAISAPMAAAIEFAETQADPVPIPSWLIQNESSNSNRHFLWLGIAAASIVIAGGIYWFAANPSQHLTSVTKVAANSAPVSPGPPHEEAPASAPEPAPAKATVPVQSPEPVPVNVDKAQKATKRPTVQKPAPMTQVPVAMPTPSSAPALSPVVESQIGPVPTAAVPPPVASPGPSSPQEVCGKRIFLAFAVCMQEQCQTPQFANHSQCVQMRQQQKESQQRLDR